MPHLTCDLSALAEHNVGLQHLQQIADRAAASVDRTTALRSSGTIGFMDLPDDTASARAAMEFARDLPSDIDTMVVLGIGGSSLGPRALYTALGRPLDPLFPRGEGMPRRLFFPDNPDPASFRALLDLLPPERTLFNVVTKSGGTAETAAQLLVTWDHLERALGPDGAQRHIVATTDPSQGVLRRLADERGLRTFDIPPSVGGRFSVLTAVGLVPAAVAGLDVMGLLDGARAMRDRVLSRDLFENPALMLAALLYLHDASAHRPMSVMMPYADALYDIGHWFRQLWAESLGKDGIGPTPIAARGATDQHSQLQLYAEGPDDKVFLFVTPAERGQDVIMPASGGLSETPEYAYLAGRGMGELLDAELRGTVASLRRRGRPCATLTLDRVDAPAVGELLMLLQAATAFAGPLYGVNPYDQPGVEEAKRLAYAGLGRPGFEEEAQWLAAAPSSDSRFVL